MNEIILELSALCIALFCLFDCLRNRRRLYLPFPKGLNQKIRSQHFIYLMLLCTVIISSVTSVLEVAVENYFSFKNAIILNVLNELYFIFHAFLSFLFTLYILNMTGAGREKNTRFFVVFLIPFALGEIIILSNPFTNLIFSVNENLTYVRGNFIWVLYAFATLYVILGLIFFFAYKNRLSKLDRSATLILITIAIMGIVIQGVWSIPVELFFESIGFLGFMLLLEERRLRDRTGKSSRMSKNFIVIIALIFLTVITININLIYHAGTDQTGKIGTIQLDNIKGNLQQTISDAEGNLLRFSMGMEQLIDTEDLDEIEKYIREQKKYNYDLTGGNCYNVYASSTDWTIIPDFDMPEQYHAVERVWYIGAKQNPGIIYISEPYIDAATGQLCFTMSSLLSDGKVVTAMDYSLSKIQDTVRMMSEYENQTALIVTQEGTIVGCTNMEFQGEKLSEAMPQYVEIFERVKASKEHGSFTKSIDGKQRIIFSNETSNGWQMILVVDYSTFYSEIYRQMIMLGAIDILMVAVIIVFYMVSMNNQEKAENTLAATESFISGLSEDFKGPVNDIIKTSEMMLRDEEPDPANSLSDIRESGIHLKEMMDDLFSYSNILKNEAEEDSDIKEKKKKQTTLSSRYIRNGIIGILVACLTAGLILCLVTTTRWGNSKISKEAEKYNGELSEWMLQHQSILRMFTDVIAANPAVLDDYDSAVKWLNDIGQNYSEMSFCYMANPYKEHQVIMNNGWVPEPDYHVEERQWYIDTERSGDGYSISSPYYDAQTGLYCITFSRVVYSKEGEFLGIFAIDCYVDKLVDVLDDSYSSEGYAFLIDSAGNILNHPNKQFEMSEDICVNIEDTIYADSYHDGDEFIMQDYDGKYVSTYSTKSEISGFTVMVVQNFFGVYGTVILMAFIFLVMLIISIVVVVVMISRFIRWQDEANERLVEAADTAVSAGKAKSRFLAQMSHEIRTPINAVLGMNEMILRESDDNSIKEYAVNIRSAGRNLLSLINSILDFSKIEEGKMEIMPVKYDTATMIENIINSVSQRADDKGLIFETHIDEDIPSGLYGDDVRISQIVVNLLTNAVKYTNKGRVDLFINGERIDDKTVKLGVKVKDTGIGIKQEDLGKMFESFTRLEETRNRAIEGTGLGMSIVIRLLDMMNSKLDVESEYGKGSEFSFVIEQMIIDAKPIGDFKQKAKEAAERKGNDTYLYAKGAEILVVDDNEMNLKVVKNLLKLNGIVPDLAESGEAALEKLSSKKYNIVLLDHMMPQMDGIETLQKAKDNNLIDDSTAVIALTANAVVGAREAYLKAGFDDYLSKPVEIKALEAALAKYLPENMVEYRIKNDNTSVVNSGETRSDISKKQSESETSTNENSKFEIFEFMPDDESENGNSETEKTADGSVDMNSVLNENGVNTNEGLNYCGGDSDFYKEILNDYASTMKDREKELDDALERNDMETYAIKVHALKSVAKTVGDRKVFEMAFDLEKDSKAGYTEEVKKKHPGLKAEYEKKADIIKKVISI